MPKRPVCCRQAPSRKSPRLRLSALAGLLFACTLVSPSHAREERPTLEAIVGTWTLVSIYEEDEVGEDLDRWGNSPAGRFVADASGYFMLQIIGRDPIRIATIAPRHAGDRRILGYAGRLAIDETTGKATFAIGDATEAAWDSHRPSTEMSIADDTLHFVSASDVSPTGAFYVHLVWKRAP